MKIILKSIVVSIFIIFSSYASQILVDKDSIAPKSISINHSDSYDAIIPQPLTHIDNYDPVKLLTRKDYKAILDNSVDQMHNDRAHHVNSLNETFSKVDDLHIDPTRLICATNDEDGILRSPKFKLVLDPTMVPLFYTNTSGVDFTSKNAKCAACCCSIQ